MEEIDSKQSVKLEIWKHMFSYAKPFKKSFIMVLFMMVCVAIIDAITPFLTGYVVDNIITPGNLDGLKYFIAIYATIIIAQAILIRVFIGISGRTEMGINYEVRKMGFDKLQELSLSYYDKTNSGWIIARMTSDVGKLSDIMAWGVVDLAWGVSMMIAMGVMMAIQNWKLTLITLSVVPILIFLSGKIQGLILERYRDVRKANSRITAEFSEGIRGMQTVKTLVREEEQALSFSHTTKLMKHASIRALVLSALYMPMVVAFGYIGTALSLWAGAGMLENGLSYGTLVAFIFSSVMFYDPIMDLARIYADLQYAQASAERVISLLNTQPLIVDTEKAKYLSGDTGEVVKPEIKGSISFKNVSFSYLEDEVILDNFSLDVMAGEVVALVGETGSGKSTIVNLACRFYEPVKGVIEIDGVDYRERSMKWLHSSLGYVLQSPYLFSGTIMENIKYGRLNATDEEAIEAAKLVHAHDFIVNTEKNYNTLVGEGGALLSQGQKQLISFARAILADPKIFVLDEATSSVDTETEKLIQDAISKVLKGRTSFVVAHRLSTISNADRILVLKKGKVIESGRHEYLMKKRGSYWKLYTNQFVEEKEAELLSV